MVHVVTTDTYRTVIAPIFIHIRLNKQEFVKALDLYVIKNTYDNVNLIKREIIKLVKTTITNKKKLCVKNVNSDKEGTVCTVLISLLISMLL